jgi:dihydropteroate synthase
LLAYILLEPDLGFVKRPADALEIRAHIEQRRGLGVEAGKHALLADGDSEV